MISVQRLLLPVLALAATATAFTSSLPTRAITTTTTPAHVPLTNLFSSPPLASTSSSTPTSSDGIEFVRNSDAKPTDEWELDCYSRPVVVNGKKLWEVLITDSNGSFRFVKTLPSNQVNSKQLRATVEDMIDEYVDKYDLEVPSVIRFFRGAMFNMINIALTDLECISRPSRCTFALGQWLEERHRDVYPKMEG